MRSTFRLSTAALVSALTLGCADQQTPTAPTASLRSEQRPDGSGAEVVSRFEFTGILITDQDITLAGPGPGFIVHTGAPLSDAIECGGTGTIIGGTGQSVLTPSDINHVVGRVRREPMVLYGRFVENACELTEADIVARGVGNSTLRTVERASSLTFAIHVNGIVELVTGGRAHLLVVANLRFNADGTVDERVVKVELKPIGG